MPARKLSTYAVVDVVPVESEPQDLPSTEMDNQSVTADVATKPTPGRKKSKQITLSDYINHPNKERILADIGDYIQLNNEGKAIALV